MILGFLWGTSQLRSLPGSGEPRAGGYGQALLPGPVAVNAQLGGRRELSASKPPLFLQTIWPAWLGLTQPLVLSVSLGLPWLRAWWELEPWQLSLQATGWTVS